MERLQKRIAETGLCSRRMAEEWIKKGRISVNGDLVTEFGTKVSPDDQILVDGRPLPAASKLVTLMLNKPRGVLSSRFDPHHESTVMNLLPSHLRHLKPVGRLDIDSEGLLLLSSDGQLIQELTHPRFEHKKTYKVLIKRTPSPSELSMMREGNLQLDGYQLKPMKVSILKETQEGTWLKMILGEGRNRQIRRVLEMLGHPVVRLKRIALGNLNLGTLALGSHKILTDSELEAAFAQA